MGSSHPAVSAVVTCSFSRLLTGSRERRASQREHVGVGSCVHTLSLGSRVKAGWGPGSLAVNGDQGEHVEAMHERVPVAQLP